MSRVAPAPRVQSSLSWFQMMVSRPNTSLATARTRLSMSPKGGRQKAGIRPPVTSAMICIVHPISATSSAFVWPELYPCDHV